MGFPTYKVAEPNSYLIITGAGIERLQIRKKAWVWPFQKSTAVKLNPFDLEIQIQAMTMEKLRFSLPAVFTIGPRDDPDMLEHYATLLTGKVGKTSSIADGANPVGKCNHVQDIVKGIIEGEMRSIVATMSMEELFRERHMFKNKVIESVQRELDQFGLRIYNANVKELQDSPGSEYFSYLSRKAHEGALNQAKVDVADARAKGEIGEADQQGKAKQEIAKINAATAVLETKRKAEKAAADAELTQKEISIDQTLSLERIRAKRAAETKDAELQRDLEVQRAKTELERQRATTVTAAKISRESAEEMAQAEKFTSNTKAEASAYQVQCDAEASYARKAKEVEATVYRLKQESDTAKYMAERDAEALYIRQSKETEAVVLRQTKEADAHLHARAQEAEASYLERKFEAQGILELAKAYANLGHVLGGPQGLMQYLMLKDNTYEKLALANAQAIRGLAPKLNVWTTGAQGDATQDPTAPIRNLFQCLPPLLSTVQEQTGITPPAWLARMPGREENFDHALVINGEEPKTKAATNGV